jgi:plastocyanin
MERRSFLAAAGAAAAGLGGATATAGCLGIATGAGLSEDEYDVGMSSNAFLPARYEAAVGDTVVWGNTSARAHTITAVQSELPEGAAYFASGGFDSQSAATDGWQSGLEGGVSPDGTYEHTFEVAGEFPYYCIPHIAAGMKGTVIVSE